MIRVLGCIVEDHNYALVALAAVICALASLTTIRLLRHARGHRGVARLFWLGVTAAASGSGIWSTHFIAMLAYDPQLQTGYDLPLTAVSLLIAILVTGAGLYLACALPRLAALGGATVGLGVGAMHFTGMAAYEVPGKIEWDAGLVAAALLLGAGIGAAALAAAAAGFRRRQQVGAAVLLLLAICTMHFTAMGAVTIDPDPSVVVPQSAVPASWVATAVALASLLVMLLATAALLLDLRERRRETRERERMRSLANAAVEGLVICKDGVIVNANESFAALVGVPSGDLAGVSLAAFFSCDIAAEALSTRPGEGSEAELIAASGETAPVEIVVRRIGEAEDAQYAVAVRDLRSRKEAEREIAFLAHHDPLTGLPNRASFDRRLDEDIAGASATGARLAVICVDLDRFKEVNDLFGHPAGDRLLQGVARALTAAVGDRGAAARLGGDEFAVIARVADRGAADRLALSILDEVSEASGAASGLGTAASLGVALYPDDTADRDSLLRFADIALYRAKSEGRGVHRFFEAAMGAEIHDRRALEHDLRHALARGELSLVYQPQADTATGEIAGFEALMRWRHPTRGAISPAIFIPLAEETATIVQIGDWALREACSVAASWTRPLSVAVNVSAVQLHAQSFASTVHEILFLTGLSPHRLEIEITETALVRDLPRALATLRQLKALGVRIAMDDFGTGYSSLSNLRAFPFDRIKIDRSFVRSVDHNEQTAAIVRSVLGLGRGLGLPVLAEGVETEAEMRFLETENCAGAQGYLLGRPGPIADFAAIVHGTEADAPDEAAKQVA